jgi:hypothetical protein
MEARRIGHREETQSQLRHQPGEELVGSHRPERRDKRRVEPQVSGADVVPPALVGRHPRVRDRRRQRLRIERLGQRIHRGELENPPQRVDIPDIRWRQPAHGHALVRGVDEQSLVHQGPVSLPDCVAGDVQGCGQGRLWQRKTRLELPLEDVLADQRGCTLGRRRYRLERRKRGE